MRVVIINNLYGKYQRGGAEVIASRLAQAFIDRQDQVSVISLEPKFSLRALQPDSQMENGVKVYRFYPVNFFSYFNLANHSVITRVLWTLIDLINWPSAWLMKKIIIKEKAELILIHNLKGLGYLLPRFLKNLSARTVLIIHDVQLFNPSGLMIKGQENRWLNQSWLAQIYQFANRKLFAPINEVISPSLFLADFYRQHGFFAEAKLKVIPNPVTQGDVLSDIEIRSLNRWLFAGQIEESKGIGWLANQLTGTQIKLTIAGSGTRLETLKNNFPKFVWLGRLTNDELRSLMRESAFLIFPSFCYENSPSVIVEALSLGLPVIAAKIGGVPELIRDGENGFLFEPGNSEDFNRAMGLAVNLTKDRYLAMRERAILSVRSFTVDNYLKSLLASG